MIKVNLLPPALRVARKTKAAKPASQAAVSASVRRWKWIGIAAGALFLLLTLFFDIEFLRMSKKMKSLNVELNTAKPQMQALKVLEEEVTGLLVPERDFLMTYVLNKAPITTVLQKMSESLPDGMWLGSFTMNNSGKERSFHVGGLAVTLENQNSIENIEQYLQKLKTVIPNAQFTYSTAKQIFEETPATAFNAEYKWQADR